MEPRIGPIVITQLMQPAKSLPAQAQPVPQPSAEVVQPTARKKKRKTGVQARLRGIVAYYEDELRSVDADSHVLPPAPCEQPPPEPDLSALLELDVPAVSPRSYAAAARPTEKQAGSERVPSPSAAPLAAQVDAGDIVRFLDVVLDRCQPAGRREVVGPFSSEGRGQWCSCHWGAAACHLLLWWLVD